MRLPRRPTAVVFDLDGTLIDSEAIVREAYFTSCVQFGVSMTDAQFLALIGKNRDDNDAHLRDYFGADFPMQDFHDANRAFIGARIAPLKPGATELMDVLDDLGAPYALATSSGPQWVERHFAAHALTERFRGVITRAECANGKPHPEPFERACALLGEAPAHVLALEDSHAGVRSAHAAGCMVAMIPDLLDVTDDIRAHALVLTSLSDVAPLLR